MTQSRVFSVVAAAVLLAAGAARAQSPAPSDSQPLSAEARAVLPLLDAADSYDRQTGFMQLEALREPATVPVVRRYLDSKSADTRAFSLRALAAIDGVNAVPTLIERLKRDRSPRVRVAAVLGLETLEDPRVLPALIDRLKDRNAEVRMAAVDSVSRFEQPAAKAAILKRAGRERDRDVRRVLEQAVVRVNGQG